MPGVTSCLAKEKWCLSLDLSYRVSSGEGVEGTQQIEKSKCLTLAVSPLSSISRSCLFSIDPWLFSSWRTNPSSHAHYTCPPTELHPSPCGFVFSCGFHGHLSVSTLALVAFVICAKAHPFQTPENSSLLGCQNGSLLLLSAALRLLPPPRPCISG